MGTLKGSSLYIQIWLFPKIRTFSINMKNMLNRAPNWLWPQPWYVSLTNKVFFIAKLRG
jgi:hypothetical protein